MGKGDRPGVKGQMGQKSVVQKKKDERGGGKSLWAQFVLSGRTLSDHFCFAALGLSKKKPERKRKVKRAKKKKKNKCNDGGTALNEPFRGFNQTPEYRMFGM